MNLHRVIAITFLMFFVNHSSSRAYQDEIEEAKNGKTSEKELLKQLMAKLKGAPSIASSEASRNINNRMVESYNYQEAQETENVGKQRTDNPFERIGSGESQRIADKISRVQGHDSETELVRYQQTRQYLAEIREQKAKQERDNNKILQENFGISSFKSKKENMLDKESFWASLTNSFFSFLYNYFALIEEINKTSTAEIKTNTQTLKNNNSKHNWYAQEIGSTGLFFEAPFSLVGQTLSSKQNIGETVSYHIDFPNSLENTVGYFKFSEDKSFNIDKGIEAGIKGAFKDILEADRVKDLTIKKARKTISDIPAIVADVSLKVDGKQKIAKTIMIGPKAGYVWSMMFLLDANDHENKAIVEKIITTIHYQRVN